MSELAPPNRLIVEARTADGSLDFTVEPPPLWMLDTTSDAVAQYYFRRVPEDAPNDWSTIREWYAARGWRWRERTW